MITSEIVNAFGLTVVFVGCVLSIITMGIVFFASKLFMKKRRNLFKMELLLFLWAIILGLNLKSSSNVDYQAFFSVYSLEHLLSLVFGVVILGMFLIWLKSFWKVYNKKMLIVAGICTVISILMRGISPFFANFYLSMIQRFFIMIPSLLGYFMIIKYIISKND